MLLRLAVVAVPMGLLLSRSMAWMSSGKTHAELISRLRGMNYSCVGRYAVVSHRCKLNDPVFVCYISSCIDHGVIRSDRVFDAMLATDRGIYSRDYPYADSPQSIGEFHLAVPFINIP